jgi:hypothetical protein
MTHIVDELIVTLGLDDSDFSAKTTDTTKNIDKLGKSASAANKGIANGSDKSTSSMDKLGKKILGVTVALLSLNSVKSFSKTISEDDAAIGRLAVNLDTRVEGLSVWSSMANKAGGTAAGMQASIQGLVSSIQHYNQTGEIDDKFRYLQAQGIAVTDTTGKMRDYTDILLESSDALKRIKDAKGAAAAQEFGKGMGFDSGTINVLMQGSVEVRRLAEEQKKLSQVTDADTKAAQARNAEFYKLLDVAGQVGREVLTVLTPSIIGVTHEIEGLLQKIDPNDIKSFFDAGVGGARELAHELAPVLEVIKLVSDEKDRLNNLGKAIGEKAYDVKEGKTVGGTIGKAIGEKAYDVKEGKTVGGTIGKAVGGTAYDAVQYVSKLGDLISRGESRAGYSSVNTGGVRDNKPERDLANMTINEVLEQQKKGSTQGGFGAAGKYQMIRGTLNEAKEKMSLSGEEKFTPLMQEQMFQGHLIKKRKAMDDYLHGRSNDIEAAAVDASKEWASIEDPSKGAGHYKGQKATISATEIKAALLAEREANMKQQGGVSNSNAETHIGTINVVTQATDAKGIAKELPGAIKNSNLVIQANHQ